MMSNRFDWNWLGALILLGWLPLTTAMAQFDPALELREFEGKPQMVRAEGTAASGKTQLFRVYHLDEAGRITKIEQGTGQMGVTITRNYTYDDEGRPVESVGEFMGNPTNRVRYIHDEKGREVKKEWLMATSGKITKSLRTEYDDKGRAFREVLQLGSREPQITVVKFNEEDKPITSETRVGERLNRSVRYVYTDKGCIKKKITTMASGREEWKEWSRGDDCRANLVRITNFNGTQSVIEYVHDEHGNVKTETTSIQDQPGSDPTVISWTFEYPEAESESKTEAKKAD